MRAKVLAPRRELAAVLMNVLLISGDLRFGETPAQESVSCCSLSPDNLKDIWTC
jgi:hypothetical protein